MYVRPATYSAVAAFVRGYDTACEGGVLVGFREWLALRLGAGWNLVWEALVLRVAFPDVESPEAAVSASADSERRAIDTLFALIAEFDDVRERDAPGALTTIFARYEREAPPTPRSAAPREGGLGPTRRGSRRTVR